MVTGVLHISNFSYCKYRLNEKTHKFKNISINKYKTIKHSVFYHLKTQNRNLNRLLFKFNTILHSIFILAFKICKHPIF